MIFHDGFNLLKKNNWWQTPLPDVSDMRILKFTFTSLFVRNFEDFSLGIRSSEYFGQHCESTWTVRNFSDYCDFSLKQISVSAVDSDYLFQFESTGKKKSNEQLMKMECLQFRI